VRHVPTLSQSIRDYPDFAEVKGQQTAKRALEVAAAGAHSILLVCMNTPKTSLRFHFVSCRGLG